MKSIGMTHLLFVLCITVLVAASAHSGEGPFKELAMKFEVNETDGDGEVVFSVKAEESLEWLKVFAPGGELLVFILANDERKGIDPVGLAQIKLETAEPSVDAVKKVYPDGTYEFMARTIEGGRLRGQVEFNTRRLPGPVFSPNDVKGVDPNHAVVKWQPVEGARAYQIEIENDDLEVNLSAALPGSATHFNVPREFLVPGKEYEIAVAVVNEDGNVSVAESSFVTAPLQ